SNSSVSVRSVSGIVPVISMCFPSVPSFPEVSRTCARAKSRSTPECSFLAKETTWEKSPDLSSSDVPPVAPARLAVNAPDGVKRNSAEGVLTVTLSLETFTTIADLAAGGSAFVSSFFWQPVTERQTRSPNKSGPAESKLWQTPAIDALPPCKSRCSPRISVPSFELREYSVCILVVDLFEHPIGQLHPVNLPPPLARVAPVGEILIGRL